MSVDPWAVIEQLTPKRGYVKKGSSLIPTTDEIINREHTGIHSVLDILNRGTEATASLVDELIFDPTERNVWESFWEGLKGHGTAESYGRLLDKAGWNPESKAGKVAKFATSLALDVAGDPLTYLGGVGVASKAAKGLGKAAKLLKGGASLADITEVAGKNVARAAQVLERAKRFDDPRVDRIIKTLEKGEKISRTDEAILGVRHIHGAQSMFGVLRGGPVAHWGQLGGPFAEWERLWSVAAIGQGEQFFRAMRKAPLINPTLNRVEDAFVQYGRLKRKYPAVFKAMQAYRTRTQALPGQAARKVNAFMKTIRGDEDLSALMIDMIERGEKRVDVIEATEAIQGAENVWADLGWSTSRKLSDEEAGSVVLKYLEDAEQWIDEFGPDGLYDYRNSMFDIKEQRGVVQQTTTKIGVLESRKNFYQDLRRAARLRNPDRRNETLADLSVRAQVLGDVDAQETVDNIMAGNRISVDATIREAEKAHKSALDELAAEEGILTELEERVFVSGYDEETLGRIDAALDAYHGEGAFGAVYSVPGDKSTGVNIRFRDRVVKVPRTLDDYRVQSLEQEQEMYDLLQGIPGVGTSTLHWHQVPIKVLRTGKGNTGSEVVEFMYLPGMISPASGTKSYEGREAFGKLSRRDPEMDIMDLDYESPPMETIHGPDWAPPPQEIQKIEGKYVIDRHGERATLRVPYLVKEYVEKDRRLNDAFHIQYSLSPDVHKVWNQNPSELRQLSQVSSKTARMWEKMILRLSKKGMYFGADAHGSNWIIAKGGRPHMIDLGMEYPTNPESALLDHMKEYGKYLYYRYGQSLSRADQGAFDLALGRLDAVTHSPAAALDDWDIISRLTARAGYRVTFLNRRAIKNIVEGKGTLGAVPIPKANVELIQDARMRLRTAQGTKRTLLGQRKALTDELSEVTASPEVAAFPESQDYLARRQEKIDEIDERVSDLETQIQRAETELATEDARVKKLLTPQEKKIVNFEERNLAEKLTPEQGQDWLHVKAWNQELEDLLVGESILTPEWIANFRKKHGVVGHVKHMRKGTPPATRLLREFDDAIHSAVKASTKAGFLKRRKLHGALADIQSRFGKEFMESDLARLMFAKDVEVHQAVEGWRFLGKLADEVGEKAPQVKRKIRKKGGGWRTVTRAEPTDPENFTIIRDHPLLADVQIPKEIEKDVRRLMGWMEPGVVEKFLKNVYDPALNWWKKWQLFAFISFHTRNSISGMFNNALLDVNPRSYTDTWDILMGGRHDLKKHYRDFAEGKPFNEVGIIASNPDRRIRGLDMTRQEFLDLANELGVPSRGQMGHLGDVERSSLEQMSRLSPNPFMFLHANPDKNTVTRFGMLVGEQIENQLRLSNFLHHLRLGMDPQDAAGQAIKAHFDYGALTEIEQKLFKRAFPFYTWLRNNLPLQVQQFFIKPQKYATTYKALRGVEREYGGPEPPSDLVPKWMKEQLGIRYRYDKDKNTYEYFLLRNWIPASDLMAVFEPLQTVAQMLTPFAKLPAELLLNKSAFFEGPIEDIPGERVNLLSPEAGALLSRVPGADPVAQMIEKALGRVPGVRAVEAPLTEGVALRGKAAYTARQFRPVNEARRALEVAARQGVGVGASTFAVGKSYGFDPSDAKNYLIWDIRTQIQQTKKVYRQALRNGETQKAKGLETQILELQQELLRIYGIPVPSKQ